MKYNEKNMKIYEILGAKQFQKIVFIIEKIKYKIIEKVFPNILNWYNNYNEKSLKKRLEKCSDEKREKIIDEYRYLELSFRKEIIYKQNQNYHIDLENPTYFVNYLKFNRKVHLDGIKSNIFFIIASLLFKVFFSNTLTVLINILLIYNIISFIINFQCVNLQNYNLCRLENDKMKELLIKREKKIKEEKIKKYGEGMKVIGKTFQETEYIPSLDEVLSNVKTNEEKKQLLLYFKKQLEILKRESIDSCSKEKGRCK